MSWKCGNCGASGGVKTPGILDFTLLRECNNCAKVTVPDFSTISISNEKSKHLNFNGLMLKKLREHRKISLRDMEVLTGFSNPYLSQLETGKVDNPSFILIARIAEIFNIPMDIFLNKDAK